jgi:outer membrane lipoprotein-sorting protein
MQEEKKPEIQRKLNNKKHRQNKMANNIYKLHIAVICIFAIFLELNAQDRKSEVFAQLRKRYGAMNSLETSFKGIEPISGIKGTLKAMRSGKYVLELSDRKITCDGHTIWNYHSTRNTVTINELKNRPSSSLDIVLFNFLYNYQPKALREYTIGNIAHYGLELIPKSGKTAMGIKSLIIYVKKGSSEIKRISAIDGNQTQVWDLEAMKINGKVSDAQFVFQPPKDAEIIDLR